MQQVIQLFRKVSGRGVLDKSLGRIQQSALAGEPDGLKRPQAVLVEVSGFIQRVISAAMGVASPISELFQFAKYGDIDLKAVNKSSTSEDLKDEHEPDQSEALKPLLDKLKATLGDRVKDVRASVRLADSPSCIVSDEEEPSIQMQQMLRAMGQKEMPMPKPTLEINPDHEIVKKLLARFGSA